MRHVAADVACSAGDQDGHDRVVLSAVSALAICKRNASLSRDFLAKRFPNGYRPLALLQTGSSP
jgi:hypothetical protein